MKNRTFCVANWKMYMNKKSISDFFKEYNTYNLNKNNSNVIFCPSNIHLEYISKNNNILLGSQNVSHFKNGAYTGQTSIEMLKNQNVSYCIIGHSERREFCNEDNWKIKLKFDLIINSNIIPILCIGEKLKDRQNGKVKNILEKQLHDIFINFKDNNKKFIIAYEPVWSIGSGKTANVNTIFETHNIIKSIIKKYSLKNENIYLLYGGSVNEKNAKSISEIDNVDGFLVGSASIKPLSFYKISLTL